MSEMPARIRVAQDADGFWTCREAIRGSPEFIRADIAERMAEALEACLDVRELNCECEKMVRSALSAWENGR